MPKLAPAVVGQASPDGHETYTGPLALAAFAALGQPTRMEVVRLLMRSEPDGMAAGALAEALECPQNTLSTHLSILARSGLINGARSGRSVIYRADIAAIRSLVNFIVHDCCDGHPELCGLAEAKPDCGCAPARRP
jgi:DNA-binding transcriptional ArsR family regulator